MANICSTSACEHCLWEQPLKDKRKVKNAACVVEKHSANPAHIIVRDMFGQSVKPGACFILLILTWSKRMAAVGCIHMKEAVLLWALGAAGRCVLATGWKTYVLPTAAAHVCAHTLTCSLHRGLYTQHAIVNSWQGFYCCITLDTQRERR